ncbi:MAG: UDP-N-acetylmuramate dehydrogenase [Holosporaceae bacterium]|jgi:UDP-N-acetylmuramate dehydrogenase|nr:UDP-N-acetylmuramate dehydrogenase [Holosporaceae bacterium]
MFIAEMFPLVRGTLKENVNIGKQSFFGVDGFAEVLFIPEDADDLVFFMRSIPKDVKVTVLGAMSNVLIRSGGIPGVTVMLEKWFNNIFVEDSILEVGAAVNCGKLSAAAIDNELGGLEFLMGIPGTIGGAIRMNAGCYGAKISDILVEFEGITFSGRVKWFTNADIKFGYRSSNISPNIIITRAWFRGVSGVNYSIARRVNEIVNQRRNSQPLNHRSCGSTFKNPDCAKAWELIDAAGCRGLVIGGAMVSEKHCNFIINANNATADDIEDLGELVIEKVFDNSGIRLEWEIVRLGNRI